MAANHKKSAVKSATKIWEWTVLGVLTVFVIMAPFNFGFFNGAGLHANSQYYFERPFFYGVAVSVAALALAGYQIFKKGVLERRHLLALVGAVIPLLYYISSIQAESPYLSSISVYLYLLLYGFFVLGVMLTEYRAVLRRFLYVYLVVGSLIVVYSFSYMMGNRYKMDALFYTDSVRLASIFTYPNAYAAFLLTLIIINLHFLIKTTRRWEMLLYSFLLVPIVASLLLTLSRGAMIALPVIVLVILLMSDLRKQLLMIVYFVIAIVLSLMIQTDLLARGNKFYLEVQQSIAAKQAIKTNPIFSAQSLSGWAEIMGISIVMVILAYLIHRFVNPQITRLSLRLQNKAITAFVIPGLVIVVSIIGVVVLVSGILNGLLPAAIADRVQSINFNTHSVLERFTIYGNAIEMWKTHPVIGGGGGAWEALYDQYQSYPYTSAQTHSYPVQLLVEIGIIGLLFVSLFLLYIIATYLVSFYKNKEGSEDESTLFCLIAMCLLIHSLIDFEMSYAFFAVIVYFSLGVLAGKQVQPIWSKQPTGVQHGIRRGVGAVWVSMAIVILIGVSNHLYAYHKYQESSKQIRKGAPFDQLVQPLIAGLKRAQENPYLLQRLGVLYSSAYSQTKNTQYAKEAEAYYNRIEQYEPNTRWLVNDQYSLATELGNTNEAINLIEAAIPRYPYELSYYEQAMLDRFKLWQELTGKNDSKLAAEQKEQILSLYAEVNRRAEEMLSLPKAIVLIRQFQVTDPMKQIVAEIGK